MTLRSDYIAWKQERMDYAALDGEPNGPTASEWQDSDDTAFEILDRAMTALALVAEAFDDCTGDDGQWEGADICDGVAGILLRSGLMVTCSEHGAHAAHAECPLCRLDREEEMEGPDT